MKEFIWHVFAGVYFIVFSTFIYFFIRQFYFDRKRREWIKLDFEDFNEYCPDYDLMIYKYFWIWDIKKFGFDPLIKLEKDFAKYFYSQEEFKHALQESGKRSTLQT